MSLFRDAICFIFYSVLALYAVMALRATWLCLCEYRWFTILWAEIRCNAYLLIYGLWYGQLELRSFHCYPGGRRRLYRIAAVSPSLLGLSDGVPYIEVKVFYHDDSDPSFIGTHWMGGQHP